ncbi:MAG: SagB/ThcOx family dehydrogenase [Candidatus Desulfacyla sp.]
MKRVKIMMGAGCMMMATLVSWAVAADMTDIPLPTLRMIGGKPLMEALKERHSTRAFSTKTLPVQVVADLLWAGFGVNRPESGKRTAPSARNWQEVSVYAIFKEGAYRYDAAANRLSAVATGDLRKLTGTQGFVTTAPLNLVYVSDITRMQGAAPEHRVLYSGADVGFISQNVYLFCASEGLATVVRGSIDRDALAKALNLPEHKQVILSQTVGYPATEAR